MNAIQDFFASYSASAWEKDSERMAALYHEDVVIFDMWDQGYQTGLAAWSVAIQGWLGSLGEENVRVTFDRTDLHEGEKAGFGTALVTYEALSIDNRILRGMKNRITLGFIKENDRWKVIHQHTSAPIDSDLRAILDF